MLANAEAGAAAAANARDATGARALHPGAWLTWLVAAVVVVFLTSNPLYVSLAFLVSCGVYVSARDSAKGRALEPFVVIGLAFAALSIPFNALTGSTGANELASLPELSFPSWFGGATFGGAITAEALVSATGRALTIATLVTVAASFNASIDHFRLLRLAPRSMAQLALSLTVAAVIVPQAVAHARSVLEAQRLRGRRARGLRALPGLLLPTLQGALERSIQRAESMDARGFGRTVPAQRRLAPFVGVGGLGLFAWGAFAHFYFGAGIGPVAAMAIGAALVGATVLQSNGTVASRLRSDRWTARDGAIAAASIAAVLLIGALRVTGAGDADYLAYPAVTAPAFHPAGALALLLLLAPAVPILLAADGAGAGG